MICTQSSKKGNAVGVHVIREAIFNFYKKEYMYKNSVKKIAKLRISCL